MFLSYNLFVPLQHEEKHPYEIFLQNKYKANYKAFTGIESQLSI